MNRLCLPVDVRSGPHGRPVSSRARAALAVLALLPTLLSHPGLAAGRKPTAEHIVAVVAEQSLAIATPQGSGSLRLYASPAWQQPGAQPEIVRAVVVIHGAQRDADHYWAAAQNAAAAAGPAARGTLLIAPQFLTASDLRANHLGEDNLHWTAAGWMAGETSRGPVALSSFAALDALLLKLADRTRFPALQEVVVAGHSAGGQVVQRYAVVGQGEEALRAAGIGVRYVIANPSSYLYFNELRPDGKGGFAPFPAASCPKFATWKYGWHGAPGYARSKTPEAYEAAYVARDVIYLLGTKDIDPQHPALDRSCAGEAQGPYRYARGKAYLAYLAARHPGTRFVQWDVPGIAHDGRGMLTSPCGRLALFDDSAAKAACTGGPGL